MQSTLPSHLRWVSCRVCNSPSWKKFHTESGYTLVRCRQCRFIYVNPQPTEAYLLKHYQHYLPQSTKEIQHWGQMMLPVIRSAAKSILKYTQNRRGRLLDIGCGFGFFLSQMRSLGFEAHGIDIAEQALLYARTQMDLVVSNRSLSDFPDQSFDILTAFYVIEHVPDPKGMLSECYRLLKPGGLLLLRWPNTAPITILTRSFYDLKLHDAPSHLGDFSTSTLRKLLSRVGFHEIKSFIGGYTAPLYAKKVTAFFGELALTLEKISQGALLMPGVSKNTIALKPGEGITQRLYE